MTHPVETYASRLGQRRAAARTLESRDRQLSTARGLLAAAAILAGVFFGSRPLVATGIAVAAVAFLALVVVHRGAS